MLVVLLTFGGRLHPETAGMEEALQNCLPCCRLAEDRYGERQRNCSRGSQPDCRLQWHAAPLSICRQGREPESGTSRAMLPSWKLCAVHEVRAEELAADPRNLQPPERHGQQDGKRTLWLTSTGWKSRTDVKAAANDDRLGGRRLFGGVARVALVPTAATVLMFTPVLLRDPSTTEAAPPGWLAALLLAPPVAAYLASRRFKGGLHFASSLLIGLPQLPLIMLLSTAAVWLDVQRGRLLAGSGEEAMSYGIGMMVAFVAGTILALLVAVAARLGARRPK